MNAVPAQYCTRRVYLLGRLRVEGQEGEIALHGSRVTSLFTLLALHLYQPQRREFIASLLWPDAPAARARRNFSDTLYRLRQALGSSWIVSERDEVSLQGGPDLWIDVRAFEQLAQADDPANLEQAIALYHDDLVPEVYEDWILERRVALREVYLTCLLRLSKSAEQHNNLEKAERLYRRLIHADRLREEAHRGLMRTLAGMGRSAEALANYAELERVLADELDAPPSQPTRTLVERLRYELDLKTAVRSSTRPPFVGRIPERAQLLSRLDQAYKGHGGMVTLLGEAGIGKSRLLTELAQAADWRGWQVVWGHGQEFALPSLYAPLSQALAAALPRPRWQQLTQLVQSMWLDIAARLIPAINQPPRLPHTASLPEQQLPQALYHLLQGLQQIAPHLLILDDMQWSDPALWPLLAALRPELAEIRVLIVISGRLIELRQQSIAQNMLQMWDQAGETVIYLSGLETKALEALVAASGYTGISPAQLARLEHASGGNPLLALSLLEAGDLNTETGQPATLLELSQRRLAAISDTARLALEAAAVIGYQVDYQLWEAVVEQITPAYLPAVAGELEQARLLLLEDNSYRFAHDTLRAAVYTILPSDRRRKLHERALTAMARLVPEGTVALLHHAEQAGARAEIADYALLAGKEALASFSYETAAGFFTRALDILPANEYDRRYEAIRGRLRALEVLAEREAQRQDLDLLQELSSLSGDIEKQADTIYQQVRFVWQTGDFSRAQALAQQGLDLVRQSKDQALQAALFHILGQINRDLGDYNQAGSLLLKARNLYRSLSSHYGEAITTDSLGGVAWAAGDHQEAVAQHAAAAHLFRQMGHLVREAMALNNLGSALWSVGDYGQARTSHQRALYINRELGHRRGEADNLDNLGGIAWVLADYATAIDFYSQALAIRRQINDGWGISISLGNLGSAFRLKGDWQKALHYYDEALQINRSMGRLRGEAYNLHGRGLALLEAGRVEEARHDLLTAHTLRAELGEEDNLLETTAALALVCIEAGDVLQAEDYLRGMLGMLDKKARPMLRQWVCYVAFRVFSRLNQPGKAIQQLQKARAATFEITAPLPPPDRDRFLQNFPLVQKIEAALARANQQIRVRLVGVDVPRGRRLDEEDYVMVNWTIYVPEDDNLASTVQRRRHVLQRLLAEAEAQGAAPTDSDLAQALGVSRRTILRDMGALARAGHTPPTRGRLSDSQ